MVALVVVAVLELVDVEQLGRGDEHGENSSARPDTVVATATLEAAAAGGDAALACLKSHRHGLADVPQGVHSLRRPVEWRVVKRTAVILSLLLAGAAGAADYATATKHDELLTPSREALRPKVQWAPSGNFSALHGRAVFEEESGEATRPYAGERREVAAGSRIFLSRDSVGASSYLASPNGLGVWAYANLNPSRFTDPDGRWGDDGSQFPYGDEASIENRCRQGDPEACEATKAALVAQGFAVCMALPGCRETMIVAGKAGGGAYAIAWLTGLRGHNEEGGHVERIPDPVTAVGSGVYGSGKECVDKPGLNMSCASFGMVVVPTAGAGANAFAKALARTQLARALTFSAYLELAPLELQAPEVAAMRVFQSGAPQMSRVAPPAALPTSQGAFSPWSSFVAPQPTMSWADAASAAQRNTAKPDALPLPILNPHFELKIGKSLEGFHPDSMIHITPEDPAVFAEGVRPWEFWARLGDVAELTPTEYRIAVVGPGAAGWSPKANKFLVVPPGTGAFQRGAPSAFGYPEYQNTSVVHASSIVEVQTGPPTDVYRYLSYPPEFTPPP